MEFKDYYAVLGVAPSAAQDVIKRAYRKLARKYHPDVSKEPDAEQRFKEVAEAHEVLMDAHSRAAYDHAARRQASGQPFEAPSSRQAPAGANFKPNGHGRDDAGRAAQERDLSGFFESLFGRANSGQQSVRDAVGAMPLHGEDHHAAVMVDLEEAYRGAQRVISLRMPVFDAQGNASLQERQLEVNIPRGVRQGQHLRLSGQGGMGQAGAEAGDLYLEIRFRPHAVFRVDDRNVYFDLPIAPWEAALGSTITAPTPEGPVQLSVPAGSSQGRKLRLKGKGLPGTEPGDLFAVLSIALPPSGSQPAKEAYGAMASAFADFNPRMGLQA